MIHTYMSGQGIGSQFHTYRFRSKMVLGLLGWWSDLLVDVHLMQSEGYGSSIRWQGLKSRQIFVVTMVATVAGLFHIATTN